MISLDFTEIKNYYTKTIGNYKCFKS